MITLTDQAASNVKELIESEGDSSLALRVAVKPGGCSGFQYDMFFDSDVTAQDQQAEYNGVRVVVDSESAALLIGASLDYANGIQEQGFKISNPNAQRSCGCGKSFS
jgi:iron-sulfur cluster assembly protein/iron-sulfur cluster insertion protein